MSAFIIGAVIQALGFAWAMYLLKTARSNGWALFAFLYAVWCVVWFTFDVYELTHG